MISVAIDGPSGVGKSSVSKKIAEIFGFLHLNTGDLYRCVAYYVKKNGVPLGQLDFYLKNIKISLNFDNGYKRTMLNGEDVTDFLKDEEIAKLASEISEQRSVRDFLLFVQRDTAKNNNVVMDGRDVGTVVLPKATVKIFLTADVRVRAKRRFLELKEKGNEEVSYEGVLSSLIQRDSRDLSRKIAPLKKAPDAILIDTSNLTFEESVFKIGNIINKYFQM